MNQPSKKDLFSDTEKIQQFLNRLGFGPDPVTREERKKQLEKYREEGLQ